MNTLLNNSTDGIENEIINFNKRLKRKILKLETVGKLSKLEKELNHTIETVNKLLLFHIFSELKRRTDIKYNIKFNSIK